jgi:hypothetical protein
MATKSPVEGKMFAQIGAIRLVRREIGHPRQKFFLAAVQPVRAAARSRRGRIASSLQPVACRTSEKKKRVLPMFFFRRMSVSRIGFARRRHGVAAIHACRHRPAMTTKEKKLSEGVDTLKNRD